MVQTLPIDDDDEVIVLTPSYAMYRFYAEVAGAKIVEVTYVPPELEFPLANSDHFIGPNDENGADLRPVSARQDYDDDQENLNKFCKELLMQRC